MHLPNHLGCYMKFNANYIHELNWKRNFLFKKVKIFTKYFLKYAIAIRGEKKLQPSSIKNVLIIRNDLIGDMIATTGLIRNLYLSGYNIHVSSKQQALEIIKHNPYIKSVIIYNDDTIKNLIRTIWHTRKYKFDLAIECKPSQLINIKNLMYYRLLRTRFLLGFNRNRFKIFTNSIYYDVSSHHITKQLEQILLSLGIKDYDELYYEVFINNEINTFAISQLPTKSFIVLNPFGSHPHRCLNPNQINNIIQILLSYGFYIVLIDENQTININHERVIPFNSRGILDIIPVVKNAYLVISVDTSIVHIASAFNKKSIAFYLDPPPQYLTYFENKELLKDKLSHDVYKFEFRLKYNISETDADSIREFFPITRIYWNPNNPMAKQIIFYNYENIGLIPQNYFIENFEQSLYELLDN